MATPEFRWNATAARYINAQGRFVSWDSVREALERVLTSEAKSVRDWGLQLRSGAMSLEEWRIAMQQMIRNIHLFSRGVARGGWASVSQADLDTVSQTVFREIGFLERLALKIANQLQPLDGNFRNWSEMYAWAGLTSFDTGLTDSMAAAGFTQERNVLTPGENCPGCLQETARGWVPIGTLLPIGERTCLRNCRCKKEYRARQQAP